MLCVYVGGDWWGLAILRVYLPCNGTKGRHHHLLSQIRGLDSTGKSKGNVKPVLFGATTPDSMTGWSACRNVGPD